MPFDFSFYLTLTVIVTGIISLISFFRKRRGENSLFLDYCRGFFPVLLVVWILRSFVMQPYRVPTGSLEPTIMPGDFIAVKQYAYGLRIPIFNKVVGESKGPRRGDITLFRWPVDRRIVFVKRVIGLPGDHIVYKHKMLYVNGVKMPQKFLYKTYDRVGDNTRQLVYVKEENLAGVKHHIYVMPQGGETESYSRVVPANHYFMMGDNRDNSDDGRQWGFVSKQDLIGKAFGVWMSWDAYQHVVRWNRIGKRLQ